MISLCLLMNLTKVKIKRVNSKHNNQIATQQLTNQLLSNSSSNISMLFINPTIFSMIMMNSSMPIKR
jgi:hypothetical protein